MFGRRRTKEESYGDLSESNTTGELSSLHGYNTRAEQKRLRNREQAFEDAKEQALDEEDTAIELSRQRNPSSFDDGKEIAEESVNGGFWSNLF